jgi:hypothetical protein
LLNEIFPKLKTPKTFHLARDTMSYLELYCRQEIPKTI